MSTFIAARVAIVATVLIAGTGLVGSWFSPLAIPFILWGLLPYAALVFVARVATSPWPIGGAGAAAITVEAGIRAAVFLFPRGSTAAIALVFSPALIGAVVMPLGAGAGWLFGAAFQRGGLLVRVPLAIVALAILSLTFVGFARPELFPTTVRARREALASIGDPRVVTGGERYSRSAISNASAWHTVGEYDGEPGDDLAIVDHTGAQLLDRDTLKPVSRVAFGGQPGRLWNWYSRLVRTDGQLAVVQTGGGYSNTEVLSLDNRLRWRYEPDANLPPTALLPADVDGDGNAEFFASTAKAVVRLNADGREVWTRPATLPDLIAIAFADASQPAWLLATRYGVGVDVWSADGDRIAELPWPGSRVHGLVDWPDGRTILVGDSSAKGIGIDGRPRFEIPIDAPLKLMQAVAWKPHEDQPAMLAMVAGGDRDLRRWRLRVIEPGPAHAVVYDEVFDQAIRLLTARTPGGGSILFVSGGGLSVLAPPAGSSPR